MTDYIVAVSYAHKGVIDSKFFVVKASTKDCAQRRGVILMQARHDELYGVFAPADKYLAVADTVTRAKYIAVNAADSGLFDGRIFDDDGTLLITKIRRAISDIFWTLAENKIYFA